MVTFRKYLGIVIMMAMLFAIFVFSVQINEQGRYYDLNEYAEDFRPSGVNRFQISDGEEAVLLIGCENKELVNVVTQWCLYTKREMAQISQPAEYETWLQNMRKPALILLDGAGVEFAADYKDLVILTEQEVPVVFCTLPDKDAIAASDTLCEILGIVSVMPETAEVEGVRLYEGFFLGGEADYVAKTGEEEKRQDMNLTVPWYLLRGGTKTYMVGTMEEEAIITKFGLEEDAEGITGYFPKLIWRNSYADCPVFAVNGEYMSSLAGMGILSAFCYESAEYQLYPVINAQNILIQNYPNFSSENKETLLELYSRSPQMIYQGIMWPSIAAMAKSNELKLSCFFNPQYDYTDSIGTQGEEVTFYLRQLREINSEAGMALSYSETSDFNTVLMDDEWFYNNLDSNYRFQMLFAYRKDLAAVQENLGKENMFKNVVTIGSDYQAGDDLVSYLTDDVTLQRITGNAEECSYMDDFVTRSIQTALLYSNVLLDLHNAVWPQEESHEWQNLYDEMASNVESYWAKRWDLEQTTLTESDTRVRTLLNLNYMHGKTGNSISLQVGNAETASYFVLRTHDEKIASLTGGTYEKLEQNVYLIKAEEPTMEIMLEPVSLKEQKER